MTDHTPNDEGRTSAELHAATTKDDWRVAEANRRLELLKLYWGLLEKGINPKKAAKDMKVNRVTLWRYQKAWDTKGFPGLIPDTDKCGRTPAVKQLAISPEEINQVKGLNLDTESTTAALRVYAQSDRCREELAAVILDPTRTSKHSIPQSIRSAVKVNRNVKLAHRGPRKLGLKGMWTPRYVDILPGDIFSSDDTTPIWAWWVPWETSKEYPYGVKLLQGQLLPVLDVASQDPIAFVMIAREKSSYRAVDIWNLFAHTFDTVGLPRLGWQLERGSWEANLIEGAEVEFQEGEISHSRRVGGLRQLPTNITEWHKQKFQEMAVFPKTLNTWKSFLPKSKSIEAMFNRMQTFEGTLYGSLGRSQMNDPFEKTKKLYEACKRGAADPRLHFLSGTEMAQKVRDILTYMRNEPMEGEVFSGVPRQKFEQAINQYPLFRMPEELRYLYRRSWSARDGKNPLRITQGWARIRLTDELTGKRFSLFYCNPRVFAQYEGEPIIAYYDRENFEAPAQIHLARTGEFLCEAEYEDRRGSFLDGDMTGHEIRKQWKNAVMSIYSTIVPHAPSRQVPQEILNRREALKEGDLKAESPVLPMDMKSSIPQERRKAAEEPTFKGNLRMQMLMES